MSKRRATATRAILAPRRRAMRMKSWRSSTSRKAWTAASTMTQRSQREPCLEMWPRRTLSALECSLGVRPAQAQSLSGDEKRVMSPISLRMVAAMMGPIPGIGSKRLTRSSSLIVW